MCYDGSFYTLTLCSTGKDLYCWGGQYGQVGRHVQVAAGDEELGNR